MEEEKQVYIEAVGRRKTATCQVRLFPGQEGFFVNQKPIEEYFILPEHQFIAKEVLEKFGLSNKFKISVIVKGGGLSAQAEAIRLGIARALVKYNLKLKPQLKLAGFLKRDPRARERKKFGLKRARRAPQWQKR